MRGPYIDPKYYSPYYGDPQKGTPDFGTPPYRRRASVSESSSPGEASCTNSASSVKTSPAPLSAHDKPNTQLSLSSPSLRPSLCHASRIREIVKVASAGIPLVIPLETRPANLKSGVCHVSITRKGTLIFGTSTW